MGQAAMTPVQAAEILAGLATHEERLGRRTGGITTMVWGLVAAGIFLTYNAAGGLLEAHGAYWAFALLWMPWTAAGILVTNALWANVAVSLRQVPTTRRDTLVSLGLTGIFLVLAAGLFLAVDVVTDIGWTVNGIMTVVNGLFAGVLFLAVRRLWGHSDLGLVAAAVVMVIAGAAFGWIGLTHDAAGLLGALVVGAAWIGAGARTYMQG